MSNSLVVQGKPLSLGVLLSPRQKMAAAFGIALPPTVKGVKGPSMKDVKAQILALGKTTDDIKAINRTIDLERSAHYVASKIAVAAMAADPSIRTVARQSFDKSGNCIGASATFRRERGVNTSLATQIATLTAKLAAAEAKLLALPA